jgi:hypothetical protein
VVSDLFSLPLNLSGHCRSDVVGHFLISESEVPFLQDRHAARCRSSALNAAPVHGPMFFLVVLAFVPKRQPRLAETVIRP